MLDDNRLYRRMALDRPTEAPQRRKGGKTSKGRKAAVPETAPSWACLCYNLQSWSEFINTLEGSKHADEDALHGYLKDEVLPIITRAWEEKEKERHLQEMVANRKRSSRLDAKAARQKEQEECEENARLKAEELLRLEREKVLAERRVKVRRSSVIIRTCMLTYRPGARRTLARPRADVPGTRTACERRGNRQVSGICLPAIFTNQGQTGGRS